MQLPDEAITYDYRGLLLPATEDWTLSAELRAQHLLPPARLRELLARLTIVRSQVAAERDLAQIPAELQPLEAGFIDLPQKSLDEYRRQKETSDLHGILVAAARLREQVDHLVVLGTGGHALGARALVAALRSAYHNALPPESRLGSPRLYFEGDSLDNDALQELFELLQVVCVDPERREERWGCVVINRSGDAVETATAYRLFHREAAEYYGPRSDRLRQLIVPVTGPEGSFRQLCQAEGYTAQDILTLPAHIGPPYSVFTAAGLLPAAVAGLDVRALLLGAAAMTRRFVEEPFDKNPVLQFAAVNYLMAAEIGKPIRVLQIWSKKLEALGLWYDQLLTVSLGKKGRGPTPLTAVASRDLHSRGQQHQEGARDKIINNLVVKTPRTVPLTVGMADHDEDALNTLSRKTVPDLLDAALRGANQAHADVARPTANLIVPTLSEHTLGQLMQLLMLATVVEGRLMAVNPYGQPGVEAYQRHLKAVLNGS